MQARRQITTRCALSIAIAIMAGSLAAEEIGEVSTVFNLLSPDHKIKIEAFDDPEIEGITCYLSRADTGGFKSLVGLDEDPSDAALNCKQVGPIKVISDIDDGDQVFKKRTSLVFKALQVVRFYDEKRQVFVYLSYSDRLIEGSPKNSISAVPVMAWMGEQPDIKAIEE